jgi:hypothetical protein
MTDQIASLGLQVDSSQVKTATTALQGLTAAAAPAATAAAALTTATAPATAAIGNMAVATRGASHAHGGLSTNAMAAGHAMRSLAEGFAVGMPPAQILAQQINHLSYAASGAGGLTGAFKEVTSTILGAIPKWALFAGGIGLVVGAGVLFFNSVKNQEKALGDLGDRTNSTIADLHALETAASLKGVKSDEFTKGMERLGELTNDAQHKTGALAELFRANGIAVGDLNQNVHSLADLTSQTAKGADQYRLMVQLGLPVTREWVRYLAQGGSNIDAANASVAKFSGDAALVQGARKFDDAWNKAWVNINNYSKTAILEIASGISSLTSHIDFSALARGIISTIPGVGGALQLYDYLKPSTSKTQMSDTGGGGGSLMPLPKSITGPTKNPTDLKTDTALLQQRLGLLGQSASFTETLTAKENELRLARLAGVTLSDQEIKDLVEQARTAKLGVTAIDSQTDSLKIEQTALGMTTGAAAAYRAEKTQLNTFERYGVEITKSQAAELHKYAEALGATEQKLAEMRVQQDLMFSGSQLGRSDSEQQVATQLRQLYGDSYQSQMDGSIANQIRLNAALTETKSLSQNALSGFIKDLAQGKSGAEALRNVLGNLESKLIDMASNVLISNLFKSLLGSVGGSLIPAGALSAGIHHTGGIVGADGPMRAVHPGIFYGAPRFHEGGIVSGEVPIIAKQGEGIFTQNQMRALAPAGGENHVQVNVVNNAAGTDVQTNKRRENGVDVHDIIVRSVGDHMANGGFDGIMRARYGNTLQPRSR